MILLVGQSRWEGTIERLLTDRTGYKKVVCSTRDDISRLFGVTEHIEIVIDKGFVDGITPRQKDMIDLARAQNRHYKDSPFREATEATKRLADATKKMGDALNKPLDLGECVAIPIRTKETDEPEEALSASSRSTTGRGGHYGPDGRWIKPH